MAAANLGARNSEGAISRQVSLEAIRIKVCVSGLQAVPDMHFSKLYLILARVDNRLQLRILLL